jgi:hypothetical protein
MADFTVITPYPGTDLYRQAVADNLVDEFDFTEYCECEPHMHTANLSRMEIMELQIKAYMKFYGIARMVRRANRWSRNREKVWILERNMTGIRSFLRFRDKSARYFWRTYRETVGKTEKTRIRKHSPLVSTPVLYSIGAGVVSAAVTLLLTVLAGRYYGEYSSLPRGFIMSDFLFSGAFVAFVTAMVATWYAVRSYRRGWIFSVRARRPARNRYPLFEKSLRNAILLTAVSLGLTSALLVVTVSGLFGRLDYLAKEVLVAGIACLTAGTVSFTSIRAVRNGEIF